MELLKRHGEIVVKCSRVKVNLKTIRRRFVSLIASSFTVITAVLTFITFEDLQILNPFLKLVILLILVVVLGGVAVLLVLLRKKHTICDETNCNISIMYGDLMQKGFQKKSKQKQIVVIPVNQCFDLTCKNGLIRELSVHGQWIKNYIKSDEEWKELNSKVQAQLAKEYSQGKQLTREEKKEGNLLRYPAGTIIETPSKYNENITFYLLALASLDSELKAQCSELEFHTALLELLRFYDTHGQGIEMFIPVMSDKTIKPPRPTKNCIDFMLSVLEFNKSDIRGKINVVVYNELKDKVSIFDN